jgi:hypothetical protein
MQLWLCSWSCFLENFSACGEMNKVNGKTVFSKTDFQFKSFDSKLVFLQGMGKFFSYWAEVEKNILSQSLWSSFAKTFCTCFPSTLEQDIKV